MIDFEKLELKNGLKVIFCQDLNTPMVAVNLMYNVGARDESPEMTGLAHLFEHLMFSGSKNVDDFDKISQNAGGENNAFTSNDVTNYYTLVPKENLEVALWLDRDRMRDLNLNQKSLDTQKKVVIEEFKQRYFNQPYGETWLHLRPLCYKTHPYSWPTIGKSIEQIENVTIEDALNFYKKYYAPNNAILVISGNFDQTTCKQLVEKYFGTLPFQHIPDRNYPVEAPQTEKRSLEIKRDVPFNAINLAFHMEGKGSKGFYIAEVLSDILSGGSSSRLYQHLVKEKQFFTEISAYTTGEIDPGLFIISGKLSPEVSYEIAEQSIWDEIEKIKTEGLLEMELQKVKNKNLTADVYGELNILNKAMKLAYFEMIGKLSEVNKSMEIINSIKDIDIVQYLKTNVVSEKCSLLKYSKN